MIFLGAGIRGTFFILPVGNQKNRSMITQVRDDQLALNILHHTEKTLTSPEHAYTSVPIDQPSTTGRPHMTNPAKLD
jgi:hypothetical protein